MTILIVKVGRFDEAHKLFCTKIHHPLHYQLPSYQLQIELLREFFPVGEINGLPPLLKKESDQAQILGDLACAYSFSGQPTKAIPLFLFHNKLIEKRRDRINLVIGLGALANVAQFPIGQLSASSVHFQKRIIFCLEKNHKFSIAYGYRELGRLMAFQGKENTEEKFYKAFEINSKCGDTQSLSVISAYHSLFLLFQARLAIALHRMKIASECILDALTQARQALDFAEKTIKIRYPYPKDFIRAYWILGEVLIQLSLLLRQNKIKSFDIYFYDEYFQQKIEIASITDGNKLIIAERCLYEALHRCWKNNIMIYEPDILLALARLDFARNKPPNETYLKEVLEIALRSDYRLKLVDLYLFCGQTLLQLKHIKSLLGLTAFEHLQKAKEYALDVSDISHLYSPVKSSADDFYKSIPEYEMLKLGMTTEERIRNGYWIAYQIAEMSLKESF